MKPTLGVVPRAVVPGLPYGIELMAVLGPIARTVADLRAALGVMVGEDRRDPWSVPSNFAARSRSDFAGEPQPGRGRIAISTDPGVGGTDPDVQAGIQRAAAILDTAGWQVHEGEPPRLEEAARLWPEINFGNPTNIDAMTGLLGADAARALEQWAIAAGVMPDAGTFTDALHRRTAVVSEWAAFFGSDHLWLTATSTEQPFEVGADLAGTERVQRILSGHRVIMATNSLGLPSVVVPVGTAHGIPQSVQIVGPRFGELDCLDAAEAIEAGLDLLTPIDPRG